jgi:C4-dicarboxylate-specific signal transduction histidine kinase
MLGELSGALAHELNQPLTAILSNAQAAQRFMARPQPELDEVRAILADIVQEDQRAHAIIQRLRRLFGKSETLRQAVDVNLLVADALAILRNDLINQGVTVQPLLAAAPAVVWADPVQLQQVLINLVLNGCDAMAPVTPAQRVLEIEIVLDNGKVAIVVSDNGTGIAPAVLPRLFEPFFTTKQRGMGLGLSICRTIVDAHEGRLWAEQRVPHGASFHLELPLAPPEAV